MLLPGEDHAAFCTEENAWALLAPWDITPANSRLERCADYRFHARYAPTWHDGRVFLAGDAAHQTPPFAGQGLCAGARDAANLAWKLDLVLADAASESLLAAYDVERIAPARQVVEFAMELGKVICVPDPQEAAARDAAMAAMVTDEVSPVPPFPAATAGVLATDTPHAGQLSVQGIVDGRPFDEVHGAGFRLVTVGNDTVAPEAAEWFESIGGRIVALTEPDPRHAAWFAHAGVTWQLHRPDFLVYGTAVDAAGATALLTRLRHDLGA